MSLLIKGGDVLDGQRTPPRRADVLIVHDKIAAVGDLSSYKADEIIDLTPGSYVAPGFIGFGAQSDKRLTIFSDAAQEDLLLQGDTTAVFGNSGVSLAPTLYGELDTIAAFKGIRAINIDWHSVADLFENLSGLLLGTNFATLAGYETIRHSIAGRNRSMSANEMEIARSLIVKALKDGAFGVSILFDQADKNLDLRERENLYRMVSELDRILAVKLKPIGHNNEAALAELSQAVKNSVKVIVSNLYVNGEADWARNLKMVNSLAASGVFAFDVFPYRYSEISFDDLLPETKKVDYREKLKDLSKPRGFQFIKSIVDKLDAKDLWITDAPQHNYLYGLSLYDFSVNHEIDVYNGLIKLFEVTQGKTIFYAPLTSEKILKQALFNPRSIISAGWSPMKNISKIHGELSLWNEKFLSYASASDGISIEDSIYKLTGYPAKILNLKDRGVIKEGAVADITIFKDNKPIFVIVSGKLSVKDGIVMNERGGKIIKYV